MGLLVHGKWQTTWYDTEKTKGKFVREQTQFHNFITRDGSSGFEAQPHRYHLYLSLACPWACRTYIFLKLKELEKVVSLSIVDPMMGENGWEFSNYPACIPDPQGFKYLHQVYTNANPDYTGRVTVPVLWDKQSNTIVNNDSAEIIRMLNSEFNEWGRSDLDYYPELLQEEINEINKRVYENVNNGVYRCGFATTQAAYDEAFDKLFNELNYLEMRLTHQRYLVGRQITEADWRLFTTLIRFDVVYHGHFKCNLKLLRDYHHLYNYMLELYQMPKIESTVNFDHIKRHYYMSHPQINPTRIIPKGPELNLLAPHDRNLL